MITLVHLSRRTKGWTKPFAISTCDGLRSHSYSTSSNEQRQVEQLKAHLRSMGGGRVIRDRQRNTVSRRPRPRPHHLKERSLAVGAVGGAAHSTGGPAVRAGEATTAKVVAVASTTRRSSAPPMSIVSESSSTSLGSRRYSEIGGDGGGDAVLSSAQRVKGNGRGRSKSVDMVRHEHDSNNRRPSGARDGNHAETTVGHIETISSHDAAQQKKTPSPPRLKDHRLSGPHTSAAMMSGDPSSPMRRLRNVRLRSPESTSETRVERPGDAWLHHGTSGRRGTFQTEEGQVGVTRRGNSDDVGGRCGLAASIVDTKHDVDDRGDAGKVPTSRLLTKMGRKRVGERVAVSFQSSDSGGRGLRLSVAAQYSTNKLHIPVHLTPLLPSLSSAGALLTGLSPFRGNKDDAWDAGVEGHCRVETSTAITCRGATAKTRSVGEGPYRHHSNRTRGHDIGNQALSCWSKVSLWVVVE